MFKIGQVVSLVANPRERKGAAFKRLKDGVISTYKVTWISYNRQSVETRYINDKGVLTTSYWTFTNNEIIPTSILGKKLEDYA